MTPLNLKKSLNKAWLRTKPVRSEIEKFKANLIDLIDHSNQNLSQHEEFHKNLIRDFLKETYYGSDYHINIHNRQDLVIHNGSKAQSTVGVIMEVKKPDNKAEMPATERLNVKALHELLLYFLRERIQHDNIEIRRLVITNVQEWFLFDAQLFEKLFAGNKKLVKQFKDFEAGTLGGSKTEFFYKEIADPAIREVEANLVFTHFNLKSFEKTLRNKNKEDDNDLIPLLKIFSPEHLLKRPFANDSNSLDRKFYAELLHIIGLAETKIGGKKVIGRKAEGERDDASLLENAIIKLESQDIINHLEKPSLFGSNREEQLFNIALELSITWINRVLFLKLLEAQLISYHKGDKQYRFLSFDKIGNYDDLEDLFFGVLAKLPENRSPENQQKFAQVPYLNSSLFEISDLEYKSLKIGNLRDERELPYHPSTVLVTENKKKRTGKLNAIQYLFEFLDAYDFSSEGAAKIQEDENKRLINASVLGLIFEKINGYKDGSFFTPGFITMYLCRESLRKAVVTKFNEAKGWNCETLAEVEDRLDLNERNEANEIVNSLKICDPAVGSGHFLVSALNEFILIKKELGILQDRNGKRPKGYDFVIENDELIVTDEEGNPYEYHFKNSESQRIQEMLFHEKQNIIENCLFGVDINPNSVKICRLRLWIELLKNAYYKTAPSPSGRAVVGLPPENMQLETLPNIDINIKCGNSLVSRFSLDADLSQALRKSKWDMGMYRDAVNLYRNAESKEQKRSMHTLIENIKADFKTEISQNSREQKELDKASNALYTKYMSEQLFEQRLTKAQKADRDKLDAKVKKLKEQIDEIKSNKIYENAFEWRFEFPEVLDDNGDFVGFDVIIGNPPYIRQEEFSDLKPYLKNQFKNTFAGTADLFTYFIELGATLLKEGGEFTFIIPNKWMRAGYGARLREFLKSMQIHAVLDFGDLPVFEEATTYPLILSFAKTNPAETFIGVNIETLDFPEGIEDYLTENSLKISVAGLSENGWNLTDSRVQALLQKIQAAGVPLKQYVSDKIYYGIKTGLNEAFVINKETRDWLIAEDANSAEIIKPFLAGRDIKRYQQPVSDKFLIFTRRGIDIEIYPAVLAYLTQFQKQLEPKPKDFKGDKWPGRKPGTYKWYEIQDAVDYWQEFEKPKILWPGISSEIASFAFDCVNLYGNDNNQMIISNEEYLLGILNSKLSKLWLKETCDFVRGGFARLKISYVSTIPIANRNSEDKLKISCITSEILTQKSQNPAADTTALEAKIDRLVYELYGLTEEEISIIEESVQ